MQPNKKNLTLSPADAAAVDAILNDQPCQDPARRARAAAWLRALDGSPIPEPAGDLAARTLAAVQQDRMKFPAGQPRPAARAPSMWRRRLAEIGAVGVAAALLLAVSIEGVGQARKSSLRTACAANLKQFSSGFSSFAAQHNGQLPALDSPPNGNWLHGDVPPGGTAAANNAANLLPLVTQNYIPVRALFCAGAGIPQNSPDVSPSTPPAIGYSYRDMEVPDKPTWDAKNATIILTDKNPVFAADIRPDLADKNSPNHDGRGTYVLRSDSSATWEINPNIGPDKDNIFTIGSGKDRLTAYTGTEFPRGPKDIFVCP